MGTTKNTEPVSGDPELDNADAAPLQNPQDSSRFINEIFGWRTVLLWPLSIVVKLWSASVRLQITDRERDQLSDTRRPLVIILWHNRLFMAAHVYRKFRRGRKIFALVSASRDGAWLAAFFNLMGIGVVRGSSSRRTLTATRELIRKLNDGYDIAVTPDGPRGPRYDFKPGAIEVARRTGVPILLISGYAEKAWRLRSWDRFLLPWPFTRGHVHARYYRNFEEIAAGEADDRASGLRRDLLEITNDEHDGL